MTLVSMVPGTQSAPPGGTVTGAGEVQAPRLPQPSLSPSASEVSRPETLRTNGTRKGSSYF